MRSPAPEPARAAAGPAPDPAYEAFYDEVAAAQVVEWLPSTPSLVLDLSGGRDCFARQMLAAGHIVLHALPAAPSGRLPGPGWRPVVVDSRSLGWLADRSVDAVLAESRALSMCLATEETALELARVLRPGGRLLLVVDSLLTGLARLADLGRWAELADVPSADCVLVPDEDGMISRCFWPQELRDLLTAAGLVIDWVRPRTVLTPAAVRRAVEQGGPAAYDVLVRTELALSREREGESAGRHLVAGAHRP